MVVSWFSRASEFKDTERANGEAFDCIDFRDGDSEQYSLFESKLIRLGAWLRLKFVMLLALGKSWDEDASSR
jgi:hypothetical protein